MARAWGDELGAVLAMAGPLVLQNTFSYLTATISSAFVGHLGSEVLSAVVLSTSLFNVTGKGIMHGCM